MDASMRFSAVGEGLCAGPDIVAAGGATWSALLAAFFLQCAVIPCLLDAWNWFLIHTSNKYREMPLASRVIHFYFSVNAVFLGLLAPPVTAIAGHVLYTPAGPGEWQAWLVAWLCFVTLTGVIYATEIALTGFTNRERSVTVHHVMASLVGSLPFAALASPAAVTGAVFAFRGCAVLSVFGLWGDLFAFSGLAAALYLPPLGAWRALVAGTALMAASRFVMAAASIHLLIAGWGPAHECGFKVVYAAVATLCILIFALQLHLVHALAVKAARQAARMGFLHPKLAWLLGSRVRDYWDNRSQASVIPAFIKGGLAGGHGGGGGGPAKIWSGSGGGGGGSDDGGRTSCDQHSNACAAAGAVGPTGTGSHGATTEVQSASADASCCSPC